MNKLVSLINREGQNRGSVRELQGAYFEITPDVDGWIGMTGWHWPFDKTRFREKKYVELSQQISNCVESFRKDERSNPIISTTLDDAYVVIQFVIRDKKLTTIVFQNELDAKNLEAHSRLIVCLSIIIASLYDHSVKLSQINWLVGNAYLVRKKR